MILKRDNMRPGLSKLSESEFYLLSCLLYFTWQCPVMSAAILLLQFDAFWAKVHLHLLMLILYLSYLHSQTWKMFQVSGNYPTYAKCIRTPPQSPFKTENHAAVSVSDACALSLCRGNRASHRSRRYHSGNWVTSHTIRYINITGGHSYGKIRGLHSEPRWLLSTMHNTFSAGSTKEIHPCNKPRQKKRSKTTDSKCVANRVNKSLLQKSIEKNKMVGWDWGGEFIPSSEPKKGGMRGGGVD